MEFHLLGGLRRHIGGLKLPQARAWLRPWASFVSVLSGTCFGGRYVVSAVLVVIMAVRCLLRGSYCNENIKPSGAFRKVKMRHNAPKLVFGSRCGSLRCCPHSLAGCVRGYHFPVLFGVSNDGIPALQIKHCDNNKWE